MKQHRRHSKESGMTLVEVLAALVILGIVFVGFMMIFPQMTNFNEKTYSKLDTMNLARVELEGLSGVPAEKECTEVNNNKCMIKKEIDDYDIEYIYHLSPEPGLVAQGKETAGQRNLYQVEIKIYQKGKETVLSETFGYVAEDVVVAK